MQAHLPGQSGYMVAVAADNVMGRTAHLLKWCGSAGAAEEPLAQVGIDDV